MNSEPSVVASQALAATNAAAAGTNTQRSRKAPASTGRYAALAARISTFSRSLTQPPRNTATAAGTKVTDSTIADSKAMTTVAAMGWNIFPSTPVRLKIGR